MGIALNGSSQYLRWTGSAILSAYPFTLFMWVKPTTANPGATRMILEVGKSDSTEAARIYQNLSNQFLRYSKVTGGTTDSNDVNDATDTSAWYPVMIVYTNETSRTAYYKGDTTTNDTASSGALSFANMLNVTIGATGGNSALYPGDVAEVALWSSALNSTDWDSLQGDQKPELIQAGTLIEHWSLLDASTLAGTVSRTLTATGSPSSSATHPITRSTGSSAALSGSASTSGHGTASPGISVGI